VLEHDLIRGISARQKGKMFSFKKDDRSNVYKRPRQGTRSPVYLLHAKTSEKRNETMHKVGAVVLLVAAVGGLIWVAVAGSAQIKQWLFARNDRFLIKNMDVTTSGRLSKEHITEFGGITEGRNLFDIDINSIRKKIEEGPLVESAEVQRRLPETLVIRVNERTPLARIAHGQAGFYFTVDRNGHVLGLASSKLAAMPVVKGFRDRGISPGSVLRDGGAIDALNVINMCDDNPISQVIHITSIDVSHPDYLELSLEGNIKVLLPRNPPRSKLEDLVIYLREAGGRISFIDLTLDRNVPAT